MTFKPSVLVVAPTASIAGTMLAWLTDAGCAPVIVSSFAAGKRQLEDHPSLLVAEVRLGEYNGLHLALRAQSHGVPAVLVGEADSVLEREAAQMGAIYLTPPLHAEDMVSAIQPLTVAAIAAERTWRNETANVSFVSVRERLRTTRLVHPVRS